MLSAEPLFTKASATIVVEVEPLRDGQRAICSLDGLLGLRRDACRRGRGSPGSAASTGSSPIASASGSAASRTLDGATRSPASHQ